MPQRRVARLGDPQGDVEALLDDVHDPVGHLELDPQLRVLGREVREDVAQEEAPEVLGRGDPERAAWLARDAADLRLELVDVLEQRSGTCGQQLARLGRYDLARGAVQELDAEPLLQIAHVLAHRGGRQPQRARRLREAAVLGDGDEGLQLVQSRARHVCSFGPTGAIGVAPEDGFAGSTCKAGTVHDPSTLKFLDVGSRCATDPLSLPPSGPGVGSVHHLTA